MSRRLLGEIALISNGKTPSASEQRESGFPVLKIRDVDALGAFRGSFGSFVDESFAAKFVSKRLAAGDTLILNAAHNANYVASKTFYARTSLSGPLVTGEWTIVRPDPAKADSNYVRYFIESPTAKFQLKEMVNGIHLYPKDVARLSVPLPPISEQRRIAAILDQADALRAKRRDAIAKLDQLLQSVFLDMFGDSVANPNGWPLRRIDEVSECLDRLRKPITAKDRTAGYVPYYGANGQQGWIDRQIFNEPLVLVAEDGGHFDHPERGIAYRIDGPAWVNNHAHILRARSGVIDTEYLHRALRHFDFMPYVSGSTRAKLTQGQLNSVPIPVPPIDLQHEFAYIVERIEQQQRTLNLNARHFDAIFASLQHRAFTGTL